jgi:hypothetical protein
MLGALGEAATAVVVLLALAPGKSTQESMGVSRTPA